MNKKLTTKEWIKKAQTIHGNKFDYSKVDYQGNNKKITIICPIHGEFQQVAADHLKSKYGCPKCVIEAKSFTTEYFIEKAKKIHGDKYDYSKTNYINSTTLIKIICPEHGEFEQRPDKHLSGHSCPKCVKHYRRSTEEFIKEASILHNNKYDYSKVNFVDTHTKVCIVCSKHGEFWQTPHMHLQGHGCPKCTLKSQMKLYEKLKKSFPNEEILFEAGKEVVPWLGPQRFDIYFPKYNIAIEYNGIQHYIPVKHFGGELKFQNLLEYDELKRQKCKENSCTLFEVKYDYEEEDYQKLVENIQNIINNYDRSKEN